jgi:hypothetical protein
MKIGGIFSDLLTRGMKKGVSFSKCMPEMGGEKLGTSSGPLNPGSGRAGTLPQDTSLRDRVEKSWTSLA